MVRNSQRTLYALDIEEHRKFNIHYTPIVNTTLNEKFGVEVNTTIPNGQWPIISAFAIGVGGYKTIDASKEYNYSEHSPLDAALFQHVPFVMKKISEDLTPGERSKYRMRCVENVNNIEYVCYYLKTISTPELKQGFHVIKTISDNISVSSTTMSLLDTTDKSFLSPTPIDKKLTFENKDNIKYVTKLNKLTFSLSVSEMEELENVFKLRNINTNSITELAICSGVEKDVSYGKELIATQIYFHLGVTFDMTQLLLKNKSLIQSINLGGLEPMLY